VTPILINMKKQIQISSVLRNFLGCFVILIFLISNKGYGQTNIVKFDLSTLTGGSNSFGSSPLTPTTSDANATIVGLTRGSGITTTGTAAAKAWGGIAGNTGTTQAAAITTNNTVTFSITPNAGYKAVSYTHLRAHETG
jgi:hypothetical protein